MEASDGTRLGRDGGMVTDEAQLDQYNIDWMRKFRGRSQLALRPTDAHQTSQVLALCAQRQLAVVPQGGNSSLSGGAVPVASEVVLSTDRMTAIRSFDEVSGVVVCEAGVTLQRLDDFLRLRGHMVPLDLGAKDTAALGGNVATNAGGLRLLRYGSMRANVMGVEAVTGTGEVLDLLSTCRKDNTGYDLKQLFIGSEGTLGVVTALSLLCPAVPAAVDVVCLALPRWGAVIQAFAAARRHLGEVLSAFEFFDAGALQEALDHVPGVLHPTPESSGPFYVVVEAAGSDRDSMRRRLAAFLHAARGDGDLGCVGGSGSDEERAAAADLIWNVRKSLSKGLKLSGDAVLKYDLSLPTADNYEVVEVMRRKLAHVAGVRVVGYGHLGDGNIHLNVAAPQERASQVAEIVEPFVYEFTAARGGSISAEHGLGQMKNQFMQCSKPPGAIAMMRRIKDLFDPIGIMNPGKLLPP